VSWHWDGEHRKHGEKTSTRITSLFGARLAMTCSNESSGTFLLTVNRSSPDIRAISFRAWVAANSGPENKPLVRNIGHRDHRETLPSNSLNQLSAVQDAS
tara:strand:+ start:2236 stop:2535 length:300 start_codon:yes stop_codon:yes gene_type:complete